MPCEPCERTNNAPTPTFVRSFAESLPQQSPDADDCSFAETQPQPTAATPNTIHALDTPGPSPDADGHAIGEWLREGLSQRRLEAGLAILIPRTVHFGSGFA
jgi:hypothetical protein